MATNLRRLIRLHAGVEEPTPEEAADLLAFRARLGATPGRGLAAPEPPPPGPVGTAPTEAVSTPAPVVLPADQLGRPTRDRRSPINRRLNVVGVVATFAAVGSGVAAAIMVAMSAKMEAQDATAMVVLERGLRKDAERRTIDAEQRAADAERGYTAAAESEERERVQRALAEREAAHEREQRVLQEELDRVQAERAALAKLVNDAAEVSRFQAAQPDGRRVIDQARAHLIQLASEAEREPSRAGVAADLYRQCGRLAFNLGDLSRAKEDYDIARRLAEAAFKAADSPTTRHRLAAVLREGGVVGAMLGKVSWGRRDWDRALQLLEPLTDAGADYRLTLAQLHMVRANVDPDKKKKLEEFGAAEQLVERLIRDAPGDRRYRFTLAEILNNRAYLVGQDGPEWEKDCRRALHIRRKLVVEGPERPDDQAYLAASLNHLGNVLQKQGADKYAEAEAAYREARDIYKALVLAFPGVESNRVELAQVEWNLKRLAAKQAPAVAPPPRPKVH